MTDRIDLATEALLEARGDGAGRRICDAVGYIIAHLRASQPATETGSEDSTLMDRSGSASRSSAAKDARITELESALRDITEDRRRDGERIGGLRFGLATERERCARVCEEMARHERAHERESYARAFEDAARRIREEPAK